MKQFPSGSSRGHAAPAFSPDRWSQLVAMLPFLVIMGTSCSTSPPGAASVGHPPCCASNVEFAGAFTDKSLYQLDSTWTNDAGQPVRLGALQGRVQVVAMFFASCTYACPLIVQDMKRIEAALPATALARTGFTLVTIDTERDTPGALHAYRMAHQLAANRWNLLHGAADDTLELAALLGVKFKREASGQFAHSNLITVLNSAGEIIHQLAGLNQDTAATSKRVAAAALDASRLHPWHE